MATLIPIVRQASWVAMIPFLITISVAMMFATYIAGEVGPLLGSTLVFVYALGCRTLIARDHRTGIALVKKSRFAEAIPYFRKSVEFVERHPWIDNYRSFVMTSLSAISYREMALANEAFCHSQVGDGMRARNVYEECLRRFPQSGLAIAALRMMDSAVNGQSSTDVVSSQ